MTDTDQARARELLHQAIRAVEKIGARSAMLADANYLALLLLRELDALLKHTPGQAPR